MEIVNSITQLKVLSELNGFAEFEIILAGGLCKSSKRICYYGETATFDIYNEIDDSWQDDLAEEELFTKTIIPEAIENSAFFYCGYQLNCIEPTKSK
jgi:hypothetical protein